MVKIGFNFVFEFHCSLYPPQKIKDMLILAFEGKSALSHQIIFFRCVLPDSALQCNLRKASLTFNFLKLFTFLEHYEMQKEMQGIAFFIV